jgi:hypothetical protein
MSMGQRKGNAGVKIHIAVPSFWFTGKQNPIAGTVAL